MIKLLIFDYNGIISDFPEEKWHHDMRLFMKKYGIDYKKQEILWNKIKSSVFEGKISLNKAQSRILGKLGMNNNLIRRWKEMDFRLIENYSKLRPFVKTTIKILKKKYKIAILSDAVHKRRVKRETLRKNKIDKLFDEIFCSCDIGFKKPQRKAYFTVLNYFKVKPSEVIFIGHDKDELEGARKFKIKTIAINWKKETKSDFYAKSFLDIPKILERIK